MSNFREKRYVIHEVKQSEGFFLFREQSKKMRVVEGGIVLGYENYLHDFVGV